jgi:hypothetical protein
MLTWKFVNSIFISILRIFVTISISLIVIIFVTQRLMAQPPRYSTSQTTSSEELIAMQENVLETTKWIVTTFVGFLTFSSVGGVYFGLAKIREAQDKVRELSELSNAIQYRFSELSKLGDKIRNSLERQHQDVELLQRQIRSTEKTLRRLNEHQETIYKIPTYAVKMLDEDDLTRWVARRTLAELSKDSSPVIRRECIRIFSTIPDYPEVELDVQYIIHRLKRLASEETEESQAVRLDARRALRKFGVDLD